MTPKLHRSSAPLLILCVLCVSVVQTHAQASKWKGMGVSTGAPLPPAENFKPRAHGPELAKAGLKPEVIAKLDIEMQRHVAAKNVAGISALIHKDGVRGWFETFGMADIEKGRAMEKDAIFRLMSMTKPVIALAGLTLSDEGKFTLDEPISKHCPEWAEPKVKEGGAVKGGLAHGQCALDAQGTVAAEGRVHVHDLHATILHILGLDHERLTYRYAGRDFRLTDVAGEVIHDVLA